MFFVLQKIALFIYPGWPPGRVLSFVDQSLLFVDHPFCCRCLIGILVEENQMRTIKTTFMKVILLTALTAATLFAQAQQINGLVNHEAGTPAGGATVSLLKATDSSTVKLAVTRANGAYSFMAIKEGEYRVMISHVGYQPAYSAAFTFRSADVAVPELTLLKAGGSMANVTVSARKPMVEVKADKTILNVEGTINAVGSNALELLRKSPGVLLDQDENISLAGKSGVQVYVDGRPTPLSGADLATYLKSLPSTQIEAIELITNPSAKYDAAGNAGIINIRLVRNKTLGANGSVNAGWNQGLSAKYNAGASLNYRNKSINIFSTYSFSYAPNETRLNVHRTVLDSVFDQQGRIEDQRRSHNFKVGADYFVNKKSTLGVMVNGVVSDPGSESLSKTFIAGKASGTTDRMLVANNSVYMKRNNANMNLNYSYADPKGKSLAVNADRGWYDLNSDQMQRNFYYDAAGQAKLDDVIYHMLAPAEIRINSLKADYEQNFKKGKLGIGAKLSRVKTDNDFQRYNVYAPGEELDRDRSNHFLYKESINAGYINYNRQYKAFMIQAGVRAEQSVAEGVSNGSKPTGPSGTAGTSSFKRSYTDLFPSAAVTFNKNKLKQWSLTYSRRIDRPAYKDLNPFEFKLDEYTFMKGNVNLRPQYTNSFGIAHTYKYKLNLAINYSHVKDMFVQIFDTVEKTKAFVSKNNLATQDVVGFTASYPFQYKAYSLFTSIGSNYSKYRADFGTGRKVELDALAFNVFAQNSLKLGKTKTWTAELSGFYNAPTVYMGSFKGRSLYSVDAGLSKQCLNGKATVKASVSDVFHTMQFRATSDFAGQLMNLRFRQEAQQFKLALSYRFGNNGVKPARQRASGAEDELKRVQQGGGLGPGGN
jgi:iron complex outermembrane recepter protein